MSEIIIPVVPSNEDLTPQQYIESMIEANMPPWTGLADGLCGADPHDSRWDSLVRHLNQDRSLCSACGGTGPINWHHVIPWHECTGEREHLRYEVTNLIPLCTDPRRKCHWIFGHLAVSWSACNPDVVKHASEHLRAVLRARTLLSGKGAA